eukprot:30973-Pelagococcus_subviridis.AAC.5
MNGRVSRGNGTRRTTVRPSARGATRRDEVRLALSSVGDDESRARSGDAPRSTPQRGLRRRGEVLKRHRDRPGGDVLVRAHPVAAAVRSGVPTTLRTTLLPPTAT